MTGGHGRAIAVNELLARVAERTGIAMGVGSQRAALRDPSLAPTYAVVRENAPHAFVIANVGISQLVKQDSEGALAVKDIEKIVRMVKADALALHLNYLEESVQPEGQTRAKGSDAAVRALVRRSPVPVIAKETGAGITLEVARRLRRLGVKAIDVGGVGGTSFAAIESLSAAEARERFPTAAGRRRSDPGESHPLERGRPGCLRPRERSASSDDRPLPHLAEPRARARGVRRPPATRSTRRARGRGRRPLL